MGDGVRSSKKSRAPDLDRYISPEKKRNYVLYAKAARLYGLPYWTFVRLAKEAGATVALRKTAIVDLLALEAYMETNKREDVEISKGVIMASKKDIEKMQTAVRGGRKYMRSEEAQEYFSIGRHALDKWAKQAKAIYKINGIKLINIEKIEKFIEAFGEEDD